MSKLLVWFGGFFIGAALFDVAFDIIPSGIGLMAFLGGLITMAGITLGSTSWKEKKERDERREER